MPHYSLRNAEASLPAQPRDRFFLSDAQKVIAVVQTTAIDDAAG
jgi:hypothetical protein